MPTKVTVMYNNSCKEWHITISVMSYC